MLIPSYPLGDPVFTWATKPASFPVGMPVWISNAGKNGSAWRYTGARWRPEGFRANLFALENAITGLTNVEVISSQYQMPAGLLQLKDRLEIFLGLTKSGVTDTGSPRLRLGTAGTVADQAIQSAQFMSAAQQHGEGLFDYRIETATTLLQLSRSDLGVGGATTNVAPVVITISDIVNSLFISAGAISNSTNNTVGISEFRVDLVAPNF